MRDEQVYNLQLLICRAVQQLDNCLLDDFHVLTPSRHDRLDLRRAEESRLICCAVSLCAPDQRAAEKSLAAVDDLIAQLSPPAPCVRLFRHPCGLVKRRQRLFYTYAAVSVLLRLKIAYKAI